MKVSNGDDQNISDAQMRLSSAKTMVIIGDADGVKLEYALAMFELRGGGDEDAAASGMLQKVPGARLVILLRRRTSTSLGSQQYWCRW